MITKYEMQEPQVYRSMIKDIMKPFSRGQPRALGGGSNTHLTHFTVRVFIRNAASTRNDDLGKTGDSGQRDQKNDTRDKGALR